MDDTDPLDDDYDGRDDAPRFPGTATAAGVIWILYGCLGMFNGVATFALTAAQVQQGGGGAPPGGAGGGCCPMLIGIAFLVCGIQTVRGTASDTRGNSIGSIVLACLQLLLAVLILVVGAGALGPAGNNNPNNQPEVMVILGGVLGLMGAGLMTAGVLGLVARKPYLAWRADQFPKRRKRDRRRDDDDDWDDDRPRRRDDDER